MHAQSSLLPRGQPLLAVEVKASAEPSPSAFRDDEYEEGGNCVVKDAIFFSFQIPDGPTGRHGTARDGRRGVSQPPTRQARGGWPKAVTRAAAVLLLLLPLLSSHSNYPPMT